MSALDYWLLPATSIVATYFLTSHSLLLFDIFQPSWYKSREISPRPKVTLHLYLQVMSKTLSHFLISFIIGFALWSLRVDRAPEVPSLPLAAFQIVICYIFAELFFWTSHFIVHQPALFRRFHALHHAFPRPIALVSMYCSNWEMIFINLPISILMPIVLQMHPVLNSLWSSGLTFYIVMKHCGHNITPKWLLDAEYHDVHHSTSKGNYGLKMIDELYVANQKNLQKFSFFQHLVKGNL